MKAKPNRLAVTLCEYFLSGAVVLAEPSLEDARDVLAALQPQILQLVALAPKELENTKPEFQEYYRSDIEPRLRQIGFHIKPSAIHWVDIDPSNNEPELICWTEGLAPSAWGAKEYLFVIKVPANRVFETLDAIEEKITEALRPHREQPAFARSLVGEGWLHNQANNTFANNVPNSFC